MTAVSCKFRFQPNSCAIGCNLITRTGFSHAAAPNFPARTSLEFRVRQPHLAAVEKLKTAPVAKEAAAPKPQPAAAAMPLRVVPPPARDGRTGLDGFEGSPLDPRYTFQSFVVGAPNRLAHAAALAGRRKHARTAVEIQSAIHPRAGGNGQNASSARNSLGGEEPAIRPRKCCTLRRSGSCIVSPKRCKPAMRRRSRRNSAPSIFC